MSFKLIAIMILCLLAGLSLLVFPAKSQNEPQVEMKTVSVPCIEASALMKMLHDDDFKLIFYSNIKEDPSSLRAMYMNNHDNMVHVIFPTTQIGCVIDSYNIIVVDDEEEKQKEEKL